MTDAPAPTPSIDARYEALLVVAALDSNLHIDSRDVKSSALEAALADRDVVIDLDSATRYVDELTAVVKDLDARIAELSLDPGVHQTEMSRCIERREEKASDLEDARARVKRLSREHPAIAKLLETRYRVHQLRSKRYEVKQADGHVDYEARVVATHREQLARAERDLAVAQEDKKRKRGEYVDFCFSIQREPTPDPAPATNQ